MPSKFVSKSLLMIRSLFSRYLLAVQPTGNCIFFFLSDGSVNMRHGQDNADPFRFLLLFFFSELSHVMRHLFEGVKEKLLYSLCLGELYLFFLFFINNSDYNT